MKKILLFICLSFMHFINAQVGIGTTSPNAALDVTSTTDGFLIPRISLTATNVATVTTPTTSELVYNTNTTGGAYGVTPGFYYWNGTLWTKLGGGNAWALMGNSGTTAGTNFVGTTDAQDLRFKTNGTNRMNISNTNGQIQSYYAGATNSPAFSWNGDPNTGMYQGGSDVLGFSTNGTERVKMNNTETVVNDASNNYDFRVETLTRNSALQVDASQNVVRFGSASGALTDNGNLLNMSYSGTSMTIDYVADFDHGSVNGSTIGLGSIEYLVDGSNEVFVSDDLSPDANLMNDLGWENSWDDVYADDFWTVSDIRMKKNIRNMPYGLKEILQLETIAYELKEDPFQDTKIGLKAQQTLTLVPEAVKTHDYKQLDESKPGVYTKVELKRMVMSYQTLVPVLIKAVQEQQEIIEQQNKRIEKLESLIK